MQVREEELAPGWGRSLQTRMDQPTTLGPRRPFGCLLDLTCGEAVSTEAWFISESRDVVSEWEAEAQSQAGARGLAPIMKDVLWFPIFLPHSSQLIPVCFSLSRPALRIWLA